ncbi:MAG: YkgJ family cysteine cluster protein [Proteobacteria bacterium]|nr:YkgJ family cysteine cluster protein [Pseudomonadota bacterium]MBU1686441.1 YkgJ family cysteine cluster protein [Pseudomonadota bacterium]
MTLQEDFFRCKQCGYCCHGETTVSLTQNDVERLVDYLRLPLEEVTRKYLRITDNVIQMQTVDGHCIFFRDGCTVHPGKPWRCREWPLHPSIMKDTSNFEAIKKSCPGITRDHSYDEFRDKLADFLGRVTYDK